MRILAFDTSARDFSVACLDDEKLIFSTTATDFGSAKAANVGSSSLLIPAIEHALQQVGWKSSDLNLIALTVGPGSFTGLRVGVVTAKLLAYANQTPLIGVNSLEVIATQTLEGMSLETDSKKAVAATNAQRQQLFVGRFARNSNGLIESLADTAIIDRPSFVQNLQPDEIATGSGLKPILGDLEANPKITVAPTKFWHVTAATVGLIGMRSYRAGKNDDIWTILPEYYRPSAAEEKAAQNS